MLIAIAAVSYIHVNNKEEVLKFSEMGGAEVTQNVGGGGGRQRGGGGGVVLFLKWWREVFFLLALNRSFLFRFSQFTFLGIIFNS